MASNRRRLAIWACVFGAATLVVGIGVASGAKKLTAKSASETLSFQEFDSATAKCKKGTKAVSGGFEGEAGDDLGDPFILPYASRADGGRKWSSAAFNTEDPGELTSFAYCRDQKIKRRSEEETVSPFETETVTARCPQGTTVASGGFDNPDFVVNGATTAIFPFESKKTGKREWTVSGANLGTSSGDLVAQVSCKKGKSLKTFDEDFVTPSPGFQETEADCDGPRRVVSGGFEIGITPLDDVFILTSKRAGQDEWEVRAFDDTAPTTLTAYAYCEKKKK